MKHSKEEKRQLKKILRELTVKDYESLRERQDKEDELLNNRTGTFLTANTILFATTLFENKLFSNLMVLYYGIAIVGILVTTLWILISYRTSVYINYFASVRKKVSPHYAQFLPKFKSSNLLLFPTTIIALWLPALTLASWFIFFAFILSNGNQKQFSYIPVMLGILLVLFISIKYCWDMYKLKTTIKILIEEQDENTFKKYNERILSMTKSDKIKTRIAEIHKRAERYDFENDKWFSHPGYTIISPTYERENAPNKRERNLTNIKAYHELLKIQSILLAMLKNLDVYPSPEGALHLTVADLVSKNDYELILKNSVKNKLLLDEVFRIFRNQEPYKGVIKLEIQGVSLFYNGMIVAVVSFQNEEDYNRLISLRNSLYNNQKLKSLGIRRTHPFTGHITLAYIEKDNLEPNDKDLLLEQLNKINAECFKRPLAFDLDRVEFCRFASMEDFIYESSSLLYEFKRNSIIKTRNAQPFPFKG